MSKYCYGVNEKSFKPKQKKRNSHGDDVFCKKFTPKLNAIIFFCSLFIECVLYLKNPNNAKTTDAIITFNDLKHQETLHSIT